MNRHWNSYLNRTLSRRELLRVSSAGFGAVALAGLLGEQQLRAAAAAGANPLAVKEPHFPARAKRVIFLFMHGGPSQVDTFDYKPLLKRDHGKPLPFAPASALSRGRFLFAPAPPQGNDRSGPNSSGRTRAGARRPDGARAEREALLHQPVGESLVVPVECLDQPLSAVVRRVLSARPDST